MSALRVARELYATFVRALKTRTFLVDFISFARRVSVISSRITNDDRLTILLKIQREDERSYRRAPEESEERGIRIHRLIVSINEERSSRFVTFSIGNRHWQLRGPTAIPIAGGKEGGIIEWHFYAVCKLYRQREVKGRELERSVSSGRERRGVPMLSRRVSEASSRARWSLGVPRHAIPPALRARSWGDGAYVRVFSLVYAKDVCAPTHARKSRGCIAIRSLSQPR
jgi:hypothetical protein